MKLAPHQIRELTGGDTDTDLINNRGWHLSELITRWGLTGVDEITAEAGRVRVVYRWDGTTVYDISGKDPVAIHQPAQALRMHEALLVDPDVEAMRQSHCDTCPSWNAETRRCREKPCGCGDGEFLTRSLSSCPRGHWPAVRPKALDSQTLSTRA